MAASALLLSLTLLLWPRAAEGFGGQTEGSAAYRQFVQWRGLAENGGLEYSEAIASYASELRKKGLSEEAIERTLSLIEAYDEGQFYNDVYAQPPRFNAKPNQLLVDATRGLEPGTALDVGMGEGRNAIYLASEGWNVTGFDVADVGLRVAEGRASGQGWKLRCVHASDEEFEFGRGQWDLIAIIYAIEKRSVYRVAEALKPGGIVVIEAGHRETSNAPFEYDTNELLEIFDGFRILRYEDTTGSYDWGDEEIRLVRLVAQKPY